MFWIFDVRYIVEIDLESSILCASPLIDLRIITYTNEPIRIIGMEIGRVAWDFEFSEDFRRFWICERDHKKWIDLLERDEIETIPDKSRRLEVFSWSDICDLTDNSS